MDVFAELVKALYEKDMKITSAESCTGGLFAAGIVSVADASKVFDGSFVTYAERVKTEAVGVSADVIAEKGVVSREVAELMASGAALRLGAGAAVGITGVAGPSGGTEEIPVGTVCFGYSVRGSVTSERVVFENLDRNGVRRAAAEHAAARMLALISELP